MRPDWKSIKNEAARQDWRYILVNKTMPGQGSEGAGQVPKKSTTPRGAFVFFDYGVVCFIQATMSATTCSTMPLKP